MQNATTPRASDILAQTDYGLTIFRAFIPDLPAEPKKGKLFPSVFRDERTPSANLFKTRSGIWAYKDFGDGEPALNPFAFIMRLKKVAFKEALAIAAELSGEYLGSGIATLRLRSATDIIPQIQIYPSIKSCEYLLGNQDSTLHKWLEKRFGIPKSHLQKWNVGSIKPSAKKGSNGSTVFLYQNKEGVYVNQKSLTYGQDGHRIKSAKLWSLKPKDEEKNKYYGWCIWGEHLIKSGAAVFIVESEKAAVVADYFYPEHTWLASRGQSATNITAFEQAGLLDGRPIICLCDADKVRKVPFAFRELYNHKANCHLVDLFPERTDGSDLCDYLDEGLKPTLLVPDATSSTMPKWAAKLMGVEVHPSEVGEGDEAIVEEVEKGQYYSYIPKEAFAEKGNKPQEDLENFGFFAYQNRYWYLNKEGESYKPKHFSNFTMKVLFHMDSGRTPRRLIELTNYKGMKKTLDIETKCLTSLATFKETVEGAGNFIFTGTAALHQRLKMKLFAEEMACTQIDVLGHQSNGAFAMSNGIYVNKTFIPTDPQGIITLNGEAFYIPSGNKSYLSNPTMFINERRLKHTDKPVEFAHWAKLHHQVFAEPSMVATLFGISCIFSDIVFNAFNFFPLLFLYGEGGSGKGELIKSVQHLFGSPQDALHLSSNANTDKSKIREMAQFRNIVICLEEYRNGNENTVNLLKGLWDRLGYKRARMDSGFGTETVPISSGVMVTGNDYPIEDPLLQRLIILEINKNTRTQESVEAFYQLKQMNDEGITSLLFQILNFRKKVETEFREVFLTSSAEIRDLFKPYQVTDRMVNNVAVLDAMFTILHTEISFPFTKAQFRAYAAVSMEKQSAKRENSNEVQRFFEVIVQLANRGDIIEGREFMLDVPGNEFFIRFTELHGQYLILHKQMHGTPGLNKQTLIDKIKSHASYKDFFKSKRINGLVTSGMMLHYDMCRIDLYNTIEARSQRGNAMAIHHNPYSKPQEEEQLPF